MGLDVVAVTKPVARWTFCVAYGAPLTVAAVVLSGLAWLSIENLDGSVGARQSIHDHTGAIRNLLLRE